MYGLAKAGFSQSYTYFTWRTSKRELTEYLTSITRGEVAEFFRPNLWPNTPDILPEHLQVGTRATFITRVMLAGTLSRQLRNLRPVVRVDGADTAAKEARSTSTTRSINCGTGIWTAPTACVR